MLLFDFPSELNRFWKLFSRLVPVEVVEGGVDGVEEELELEEFNDEIKLCKSDWILPWWRRCEPVPLTLDTLELFSLLLPELAVELFWEWRAAIKFCMKLPIAWAAPWADVEDEELDVEELLLEVELELLPPLRSESDWKIALRKSPPGGGGGGAWETAVWLVFCDWLLLLSWLTCWYQLLLDTLLIDMLPPPMRVFRPENMCRAYWHKLTTLYFILSAILPQSLN